MKKNIIKLATRPSKLAMKQSRIVADLIESEHDVKVELIPVTTHGDKDQTTPITQFSGTGAFVKELEIKLLKREADIAVHSLKDVPSILHNDLNLVSYPLREDSRDVFISKNWKHWSEMPEGSIIGTSSFCRKFQMSRLRPDFKFREIRGNIDTRIQKCMNGEYDGIILAAAGLNRLGISYPEHVLFEIAEMIPSPGQGALVIQSGSKNKELLKILQAINNPDIEFAVTHERLFMKLLDGGCREPLGAFVALNNTTANVHLMSGNSNTLTYNTSVSQCVKEHTKEHIIKLTQQFKNANN